MIRVSKLKARFLTRKTFTKREIIKLMLFANDSYRPDSVIDDGRRDDHIVNGAVSAVVGDLEDEIVIAFSILGSVLTR